MFGQFQMIRAHSIDRAVEGHRSDPMHAHNVTVARPGPCHGKDSESIKRGYRPRGRARPCRHRGDPPERNGPITAIFGDDHDIATNRDDSARDQLTTGDLYPHQISVCETTEKTHPRTTSALQVEDLLVIRGVRRRARFGHDSGQERVNPRYIGETRRIAERFIHIFRLGVDSPPGSDMKCQASTTNNTDQRQTTTNTINRIGAPRSGPHPGAAMSTATTAEQPLPLDWALPSGLPATPARPRHLRLVTPTPDPAGTDVLASGGRLPAPAPWVARLAPAILEVAAGERPPGQLSRWVTADIRETLARRGAAARRHPAGKDLRPQCRRVRSVRVTSPTPGVIEASAVVIGSSRARAVALRLEAIRGRWLATAVEFG